ncbi:DUF2169 family type VI secretion system accessory protein [Delftia acidovorans]
MQLQQVDNYTPFEWFAFEKMGPGKRMYDVLIVKAACQLVQDKRGLCLAPAPQGEVPPIHMADQPREFSRDAYASLQKTGDVLLHKIATDFLISGAARPASAGASSWAAEVAIKSHGATRKQTMFLHGERHWQWSLLKGWHLSAPKPCDYLELHYELAYGGSYQQGDGWIRHDLNPVGRGHLPVHRMDKEVHYPAARIELAANPLSAVDKPIAIPALGPIARTWGSRKRHAGTYDAQWKEDLRRNQTADYPADFNPRFLQAAHPDWIFEPYWTGHESIQVLGLTADKPLHCDLPGWRIAASGQGSQGTFAPQPMNLDTVELDLDARRLYMTWRLTMNQAMQTQQVRIDLAVQDTVTAKTAPRK